ncbi:polysaccharide deacetylase family protein [Spongorhabdus nitratireducens]
MLQEYDPDNYYFQRRTAISWGRFIQLLDKIEADGCETLPVSALGKASPQSVFITFDDGYADNFRAIKELLRRGMTATIFPVRNFSQQQFSAIDDMAANLMMSDAMPADLRASIINGRIKKIARRLSSERYRFLRAKLFGIAEDRLIEKLFLTEQQLSELVDSGIGLGIHGCSHRIFSSLPEDILEKELQESLDWLISLGISKQPAICFPHGAHDERTVEICSQYSKYLLGVDCKPVCKEVHRRIHVKEDT